MDCGESKPVHMDCDRSWYVYMDLDGISVFTCAVIAIGMFIWTVMAVSVFTCTVMAVGMFIGHYMLLTPSVCLLVARAHVNEPSPLGGSGVTPSRTPLKLRLLERLYRHSHLRSGGGLIQTWLVTSTLSWHQTGGGVFQGGACPACVGGAS